MNCLESFCCYSEKITCTFLLETVSFCKDGRRFVSLGIMSHAAYRVERS